MSLVTKWTTYKENHLTDMVKYGNVSLMPCGCFVANGSVTHVKVDGIMISAQYKNIVG